MVGVVFNEMKGVLSDSEDLFGVELTKHLFADNIYTHNFGGDPEVIPNLTHENLISFHKKYYHPSNCIMYSYGDLPPSLNEIDTLILQKFNKLNESFDIELQPLYDTPRTLHVWFDSLFVCCLLFVICVCLFFFVCLCCCICLSVIFFRHYPFSRMRCVCVVCGLR